MIDDETLAAYALGLLDGELTPEEEAELEAEFDRQFAEMDTFIDALEEGFKDKNEE